MNNTGIASSPAVQPGGNQLSSQYGPGIRDLQRYVERMQLERGFASQTLLDQCLLLGEEVGELFKAVRHRVGLPVDLTAPARSLDHELADVLIYLCSIANRAGVDLASALDAKEAKNRERCWSQPASSAPGSLSLDA